MGTRCLTTILEDGKPLLTMYRQYDGYPSRHGQELKNFLVPNGQPRKVVSGYTLDDTVSFNGIGCLAAQIVAHFKVEIGNIYIEPAGRFNVGEEFTYILSTDDKGDLRLKVTAGPVTFFGMDLTEADQSDDEIIYNGLVADWEIPA